MGGLPPAREGSCIVTATLALQEWLAVSAREGEAAELTITLPALLEPVADLSE